MWNTCTGLGWALLVQKENPGILSHVRLQDSGGSSEPDFGLSGTLGLFPHSTEKQC